MFTAVLFRCLVTSLWILPRTTITEPQASECTYTFIVPDLDKKVLNTELNINISINFHLEASPADCRLPDNTTITVWRKRGNNPFRELVCKIKHTNGICDTSVQDSTCTCLSNMGWYQLSKTVGKHDNATWVWTSNIKNVNEVNITLTSPANSSKTSVPADTETATTQTSASEDTTEPSASQHGVDLTVVISVTIAALAVILVSFRCLSVIKARKYRASHDSPTEVQSALSLELQPPRQEAEGGNGTSHSHETNYYWEIPDESSPPSPDPPKECDSAEFSGGYSGPSVSPDVKASSDGARNVAPFFDNSVLCSVLEVQDTVTEVMINSPPPSEVGTSTDSGAAASSGYMDMSGILKRQSPDTCQQRTEYMNVSHGITINPPAEEERQKDA